MSIDVTSGSVSAYIKLAVARPCLDTSIAYLHSLHVVQDVILIFFTRQHRELFSDFPLTFPVDSSCPFTALCSPCIDALIITLHKRCLAVSVSHLGLLVISCFKLVQGGEACAEVYLWYRKGDVRSYIEGSRPVGQCGDGTSRIEDRMVLCVSVVQFSKPLTTRHLQQPLQVGGELVIVHTLRMWKWCRARANESTGTCSSPSIDLVIGTTVRILLTRLIGQGSMAW